MWSPRTLTFALKVGWGVDHTVACGFWSRGLQDMGSSFLFLGRPKEMESRRFLMISCQVSKERTTIRLWLRIESVLESVNFEIMCCGCTLFGLERRNRSTMMIYSPLPLFPLKPLKTKVLGRAIWCWKHVSVWTWLCISKIKMRRRMYAKKNKKI